VGDDGNLYLFGGGVSAYDFIPDFWKYVIASNEWIYLGGANTPSVSLPSARTGATLWTSEGKLYLLGGTTIDFLQYLSDIWVYDQNVCEPYPECACNASSTCNGQGQCNSTQQCVCNEGFTGSNCNKCDVNYYNYPDCNYCLSALSCSGNGDCGSDGACKCHYGFTGATCNTTVCSAGYCGGGLKCCDDIQAGPSCYDPVAYHCLEGAAGVQVLCLNSADVCGTSCYDSATYSCCNDAIYFSANAEGNPCI